MQHRNHSGFTMIEMIITVAVLSIGVLGIYSAFSPFVEISYNTNAQFKAMYLAQEGFEIIRNIRDNNVIAGRFWSSGLSDCSNGCQADYRTGTTAALPENYLKIYNSQRFLRLNADGFYGYDRGGLNTTYQRKITITQPEGNDSLRVLVEVFWKYNNKPYRVETTGYLYRFKN